MSEQTIAEPKQEGKATGREAAYHGRHAGRAALKERQLGVSEPRLRKKSRTSGGSGEVAIPA